MHHAEQIKRIEERIIDPFKVDNFLTEDQIVHLIKLFYDNAQNQIVKNTGPISSNIEYFLHDKVVDLIFSKIVKIIGNFHLTAGFFFKTDRPHIIHNDDLFQLPDGIYRAIAMPLKINRSVQSEELPKLCFFDQFYFHGPSKFFKGSEANNIPTYYNQQAGSGAVSPAEAAREGNVSAI